MSAYVELSAVSVPKFRSACTLCALLDFCWPPGLAHTDLDYLHQFIRRTGQLRSGKHVFRTSDRATAIYAIRTGCVKTYTIDSNGHEHVHGFHLPGELLGFDATYSEHHRVNAVITKDSSICMAFWQDITRLTHDFPGLRNRIVAPTSSAFSRQQAFAEATDPTQRAVLFLFDIEARLRRRHDDSFEFELPMSRGDIASYLGFTVETLNRVISMLKAHGMIYADRCHIRLLDVARLNMIAEGVPLHQTITSH